MCGGAVQVLFGLVRPAQQIVKAHLKVISYGNQGLIIRTALATFIILIGTHTNLQMLRHLALFQFFSFAGFFQMFSKWNHFSQTP